MLAFMKYRTRAMAFAGILVYHMLLLSCSSNQKSSCTPGDLRCNVYNNVETCNQAGDDFEETEVCTGSCQDGVCRDASDFKKAPRTYFESSWETTTGKSDRAVMDGGRWDDRTMDGGIQYIEVVTALDIPGVGVVSPIDGDNMLSIGANGGNYENVRVSEFIREDDEHTYMRFYMYVLRPSPQTIGAGLHGIQDIYCPDDEESLNFYTHHGEFTNNGYNPGWLFRSEEPGLDYDYFGNGHTLRGDNWEMGARSYLETPINDPGLEYNRWYRFEIHIHWLAEKTIHTPALYYMKVYDDANEVVLDENNLYCDQYDGAWNTPRPIGELYSLDDDSQGRRIYIHGNHRCLMLGSNGSMTADEPRLFFIDKLAFSAEGWIGE